MKAFILESEEETIAVIKLTTDKYEFYRNVRLAIAEHYVCEHDDVGIVMSEEEYNKGIVMSEEEYSKGICSRTMKIASVEQSQHCIRNYTLTETCVYG